MSRIIFRKAYIIVLPSFETTAVHGHPFLHLFCSADGCSIHVAQQRLRGRCLVTAPNVQHAVPPGSGIAFFLLIDPTSHLADALQSRYLQEQPCCSIGQAGCIPVATDGLSDEQLIRAVEEMLAQLGLPSEAGGAADERIDQVIGKIISGEWLTCSVGEIAANVFLSESRLTHLFKDSVGISLKSYLVIRKLERAWRYIASGGRVTRAAQEGGFASSAHLAYTCRRLTGISVSEVLKARKTADF